MGLLSILDFTGRRWRRQRAAVEAALQRGDHMGAAEALCLAIRTSRPNWENGSRESRMRDLDHLAWCAETLAAASSELRPELARITRAVAGLRGFLADRENFGLDGRMVRRTHVRSLLGLESELKRARADF
ncbi:MAG: hypothetical protein WD749_12130 [Phycisphaerales bacterium]